MVWKAWKDWRHRETKGQPVQLERGGTVHRALEDYDVDDGDVRLACRYVFAAYPQRVKKGITCKTCLRAEK